MVTPASELDGIYCSYGTNRMSTVNLTKTAGFTLVELAIALLIIGVLLGSLLAPLSTQVQLERTKSTRLVLDKVKDALMGFAISNNGRIPCSDTDGDGMENKPCASTEGELPYATLGLGQKDAWTHRLRYRPDASVVVTPVSTSTLSNLRIVDSTNTNLTDTAINSPVLAVIFSVGADNVANGDNNNGDNIYVDGEYVLNVHDDILVWLSKNTFYNRLAEAGKPVP
jgi:prepilin-type N-terminal cleavage/methylation domain-containing protein